MLELDIPAEVLWDPVKEEFVHTEARTLRLEHSLASLAKWESKWKKPFLSDNDKTEEEVIDYLRCMSLDEDTSDFKFEYLPQDALIKIRDYINDPMTATTITRRDNQPIGRREIITAEIIYYWLVALQIPFEVQYWHLNRTLMLINVCNEKQKPSKKMSRNDILSKNRALNAARRARLGSTG